MHDYLGYLKLARSLASSQNLTVKFEDDPSKPPRTDGKTLYLPRPNPLWDGKDWSIWNDACWHEIGHNFPENRDIFKELGKQKIDCTSLFGSVLNLTDDYRVDKSRTAKFYGMMEANAIAIPHHIKRMAKQMTDNPDKLKEKGVKVICTMMTFDADMRSRFNPDCAGMDAYTEGLLDDEAKGWLKTLRKDYASKYCNNKKAVEEIELVRDMFRNVFKIDPEEAGDGKGQGDGEGEGDSGSSEDDSQDGDSKGKGKSKKAKYGSVSYEEWLKHPTREDGKPSAGCHIEYTSDAIRHYNPHTDQTNKIYDYSKGEGRNGGSFHCLTSGQVKEAVSKMGIHTIVGAARRLLQVETRKRPHFNQKKGRLDTSKIYRVTMPETSASERLFKTKEQSLALDTAVSVLVDYSGSMGGRKIEVAASAAVALNELFRTLRVNCEILGFSEPGHTNATFVFKPFNTPVNDDNLAEYMSEATGSMGNNCDGDNILIAASRLRAQKQARKVLVVLSDGSPCGGDGDIYGFTKKVISKIEEEKQIDILGIGIMDTNVTRLYKNNRVIKNLNELPSKLIETLEHILLEKKK